MEWGRESKQVACDLQVGLIGGVITETRSVTAQGFIFILSANSIFKHLIYS